MYDGAGDGGAELIAAQFGLRHVEIAGGVQHVVADELVERRRASDCVPLLVTTLSTPPA